MKVKFAIEFEVEVECKEKEYAKLHNTIKQKVFDITQCNWQTDNPYIPVWTGEWIYTTEDDKNYYEKGLLIYL